MKVLILCGGKGVRLEHDTEFIPKAMVKVGRRPMIWNVMKIFARFEHTDFVLALGKKGELIRDYFLNFNKNLNDITISLKDDSVRYLSNNQEQDWSVTCVETGEHAGTGARLSRCEEYLGETFLIAYSDCLADVNIDKVIESHAKSGKILTVTSVMPPYRYGEFIIKDDKVVDFSPTSLLRSENGGVNGGFMVCDKRIFEYVNPFDECVLENEIFKKLAADGELNVYRHEGFWECLDTDREYAHLNSLCERNLQYWLFNK